MKSKIYIIFIFFSLAISAQKFKLSGTVKDSLGNPLIGANIVVKQQNKMLTYAITDDEGQFIKIMPKGEDYEIKVSYLGFESKKRIIPLFDKDLFISIVLKESNTSLKEIVLSANIPETIQKKDTIIYNLKALTDGTEITLKDVIEKLPGMSINENGKVEVNGKQIDKILINGKQFFNEQHQLATENISSEMIQGIEFYTRFKTEFDSRADNSLRALNIKLKNKYLNKVSGNALLSAGYNEKYRIHSNVFHFRKHLNLALIGDVNNLGKQAISLNDYIELRGGVKNFIKGELVSGHLEIEEEEIPDFLLSEHKLKEKKIYFGGLNIVYEKPRKMVFNGFYLYNLMNNKEDVFSNRIFWDDTFEKNQKLLDGKYVIFNSTNEFKYRFSPDKTLSLLVTTDWQHTFEDGNYHLNNQLLNFDNNHDFLTLGTKFNFTKNINENNIWDTQLLYNYKNRNKVLILEANHPFLEDLLSNTTNFFNQNTEKYTLNYSFFSKWSHFYKRTQLSWDIGIDYINNQYVISSILDSFNDDLDLTNRDYHTGLRIKYDGLAFHLNSKIDLHYTYFKFNDTGTSKTNFYISPFMNVLYLFNLSHSISLSYIYSNKLISPVKLLSSNYFIENNSIYKNTTFDEMYFPANQIVLYYNNYIKKYKLYYNFSANYNWKDKSINSHICQSTPLISYYENSINNFSQNWYLSSSINKLLYKHVYFNYKLTANFLINELENNMIYKNKKIVTVSKLYSKYKKSPLNFVLGFKYIWYKSSFESDENNMIFDIYQPFISLKGKLNKKLYWNLLTKYEKYNLAGDNYYFNIKPTIEYKFNKKFYLSIIGNNILNLKKFQQIEWKTTNNYAELKKVYDLPGYILLQSKLMF